MWRSRVFWQLFGSSALLILFSLGLFSYLAINQIEQNELGELQARLHAQALLIQEALRDREPSQEQPVLERIRRLSLPLPTRVTLIARDGRVLAESARDPGELENHADRPEISAARRDGQGQAIRHSATTARDFMYLAVRADLPGSDVDVIRVAFPLESVQRGLLDLRRLLAISAGLTALTALALALWLTGSFTRPLRALIRGADEIAAGHYGHRVNVQGANEIGLLAHTFNHMSERLAKQFAQLEEDRQQLRTVLSSMIEGVIAIDSEQRILFANERAAYLLDFPVPAALGRHLWEMVRQRKLQELLREVMASPDVPGRELSWSDPGQRSLTVHVARLPGPSARGAVLVFHDTTELRRLERLRQEFVANVSHELKTPLAIIQATVETLIDGAIDDIAHRGQFLERIAQETQRLDNLTSDLLQLARVESETEVFTREALDVAAIVQDCLDRHRTLAEGKRQTLAAVPPAEGQVRAWADEEALRQILNNLVNNAVKYTPEGGQVSVSWQRDNNEVILEVRDTGIGIARADLPRIFERFYRVDRARSRELGGTGLGLAIVKHLTQAMQGSVQATSEPGHGSTFRVTLPVAID